MQPPSGTIYSQQPPPKPTHKVSFYGVRCFLHEPTGTLWGCNRFWDSLIMPVTHLHWFFSWLCPGCAGDDGFPFKILEEY